MVVYTLNTSELLNQKAVLWYFTRDLKYICLLQIYTVQWITFLKVYERSVKTSYMTLDGGECPSLCK